VCDNEPIEAFPYERSLVEAERAQANPYVPELVRILNEVNSDDVVNALMLAFNTRGIANTLWRLCEAAGMPPAMSLVSGKEQFVITKPEED
jgi:hypothetical protein